MARDVFYICKNLSSETDKLQPKGCDMFAAFLFMIESVDRNVNVII